MKYRFLISPNVYAVGCELNNLQLTAQMLYLKKPFTENTKVCLYDRDSNLAAIVEIEKTNIQEHQNITLNLCH